MKRDQAVEFVYGKLVEGEKPSATEELFSDLELFYFSWAQTEAHEPHAINLKNTLLAKRVIRQVLKEFGAIRLYYDKKNAVVEFFHD